MAGDYETPVGWVRDERGALRRETIHRMGRRLPGFDYSARQIYEITVVLAERRPILGRLEKGAGGEWAVAPSALGEAVLGCWRELPAQWPQVELIEVALMPDHFHGILFVKSPLPKGKSLGNVIGAFKSRSASAVGRLLAARGEGPNYAARGEGPNYAARGEGPNYAARGEGPNYAARGEGPNYAGGSARGCVQPRFWAEGYVDTILFREGQLATMIAYLRDNPRRLGVKRENPELFRVSRSLRVAFASPSIAPWDGPAFGEFAAIGNHFLLERGDLRQVQVSRADFAYRRERLASGSWRILRDAKGEPLVEKTTPAFEEKAARLLEAARKGAVLVSPSISHGEREIARRAFNAGYRVIALQNKGFSPVYKPGGRLFDQCAAGNLLLLAPIAWPYQPGEKPPTRESSLTLNRIAQLIAGEGAAEIRYRFSGASPHAATGGTGVDSSVRECVSLRPRA